MEYTNEEIYITAGTVEISGSGTNYTIDGDVTLVNGEKLKFSYSGSFEITDSEEED